MDMEPAFKPLSEAVTPPALTEALSSLSALAVGASLLVFFVGAGVLALGESAVGAELFGDSLAFLKALLLFVFEEVAGAFTFSVVEAFFREEPLSEFAALAGLGALFWGGASEVALTGDSAVLKLSGLVPG
jgi:hypothetical protein